MVKSTIKKIEIGLPEDYNFRYTLRFLIDLKSVSHSKKKNSIIRELSIRLDIGVEMLKKYIAEKQVENYAWSELSLERRTIMADYFGLEDPDHIVTEKYQ